MVNNWLKYSAQSGGAGLIHLILSGQKSNWWFTWIWGVRQFCKFFLALPAPFKFPKGSLHAWPPLGGRGERWIAKLSYTLCLHIILLTKSFFPPFYKSLCVDKIRTIEWPTS